MTRAILLIGPAYDEPVSMPADARHCFAKRAVVQGVIERVKDSGNTDDLDLVWWEMALLRFSPVPGADGGHYAGESYEKFAASFGVTPATADYALERAGETQDLVLHLHYLGFALDRMPHTGKAWIERQREMLLLWQRYSDETRDAALSDSEGNAALFVENALVAIGSMVSRAGVLRGHEPAEWAAWLLQLAVDVRTFPGSSADRAAFWRHRWVAPYLRSLTALPASAADAGIRDRAFALLADAAAYYAGEPLTDTFAHLVAEARYELRMHWGDKDAHKDKIRDQFAAILRRAELHKATGNGMLSQSFFRAARSLAEEQRQYFSTAEIDELMHEERAAIEHAIQSNEFKGVSVSVHFPADQLVRIRNTPEETVAGLFSEVAMPIPTRASLAEAVESIADETPLRMMLGTTIIGGGKVVGESSGEEKNLALAIEQHALLGAKFAGQAMSATIIAAATKVGLTADHLMAPLAPLMLDGGTSTLIHHGCERLIAGDFISSCHILVPRVEDVLRQHLRSRGLHATEFKRDVGDGTSRTDDEPLGSMLARTLSDGTTVRDHLGEDFAWHIERTMTSQTGLNLRNTFAHGQARPAHCAPENAGIVLAILYKLAAVAGC
jgi:hypothetical protein